MNLKFNKVIQSLSLVIASVICLVGVSYSWFSSVQYIGYGGEYSKRLILAGVDVNIKNYVGYEKGGNSLQIEYLEMDPMTGIDICGLYPGGRQYYKTVVTNQYSTSMAYSVYLFDVVLDKELEDYITINVTAPIPKKLVLSDFTENTKTDGKVSVRTLSISDKYPVNAGSSYEIYWFIEFSEEAGNECSNKSISIGYLGIGN